jgi:ATP-dependent DNA helicase RecG
MGWPIFSAYRSLCRKNDYLKTVISVGNGPESDPGNHRTVLKDSRVRKNGPEKEPEKDKMTLKDGLQAQLLTIIKSNPMVTYDELALKTGKSRSSVKQHIHELKTSGLIERIGHAKGGHWKVVN